MINGEFSLIEFNASKKYFEKVSPNFDVNNYFTQHIQENKVLDSDFNTSNITSPIFRSCTLNEVKFNGIPSSNSIFYACTLNNCILKDTSFDYSDLSNTIIQDSKISSCNFDNSNFTNSKFINDKIQGVSFKESLFYKSEFNKTSLKYTSFNNSIFDSIYIDTMDFSSSNLNYVYFKKIVIKKTIFGLFTPLYCFGGLDLIVNNKNDVVLKIPETEQIISADEFLDQLEFLLPLFLNKKDYFPIANIYIFLGETKKAFTAIKQGIVVAMMNKSFSKLKALVKLASFNKLFTKQDLEKLYSFITKKALFEKFNYHEFRAYINEINEIHQLLIEMPFNTSKMQIEIVTNVPNNQFEDIPYILEALHSTLKVIDENILENVSIKHKSPYTFIIELFDNFDRLLQNFGSIAYLIWGASALTAFTSFYLTSKLKSLEIKKSNKEIDKTKIEVKKAQAELEKVQLEQKILEIEYKKKTRNNELNQNSEIEHMGRLKNINLRQTITVLKYTIVDEYIPPDARSYCIKKEELKELPSKKTS